MTPTETKPSRSKERYHIKKRWTESYYDALLLASAQDLERWANDPNCIEKEFAAQQLQYRTKVNEERIAEQAATQTAENTRLSQKRQKLLDNPFTPRTEVSADAGHIASKITKTLWIIFVLLPVVFGILAVIVMNAR